MMNLGSMMAGLQGDRIANLFLPLWEHGEGSLQFWRASVNFVYAFKRNADTCFLRFSLEQDHTIGQMQAELDFMDYLHRQGYPCVTPVRSRNGNHLETVHTNECSYYAVVFTPASGSPVDLEQMTPDYLTHWGQSLARLHSLSKTYQPAGEKRRDWQQALDSIRATLQRFPEEQGAMDEWERVKEWLLSLQATDENYGLVHYDFQPDNVFWEPSNKQFHVFDFDDSMYHWFTMDIVTALVDLFEQATPEATEKMCTFLDGYRSIMPLDDDMTAYFPRFLRFHKLNAFSRLLRALETAPIQLSNSDSQDIPSWYDGLRTKLKRKTDEMRRGFQNPWE